jgi:hypothetical protein
MIGRCVWALVVNKLTANPNYLTDSNRDVELECLSATIRDITLPTPGNSRKDNLN